MAPKVQMCSKSNCVYYFLPHWWFDGGCSFRSCIASLVQILSNNGEWYLWNLPRCRFWHSIQGSLWRSLFPFHPLIAVPLWVSMHIWWQVHAFHFWWYHGHFQVYKIRQMSWLYQTADAYEHRKKASCIIWDFDCCICCWKRKIEGVIIKLANFFWPKWLFLCMNGVDIGATMSPLIFLKKIHQVCLQRSILHLLTRDWPISSHFWVISCILSSYFHSTTSIFHCINMFYFIKYFLQAPALACDGFHLVCNSFSLVVERSLGLKQSLSHLIVAYFILSPLTNITSPWHQSRYVVLSISLVLK